MTNKEISRRIWGRYLLRCLLYPVIFAAGVIALSLLGAYIAYSINWTYGSPVYRLFKSVANYYSFIFTVILAVGVAVIFVFQLWRNARDTTRLAAAIEQIALRPEEEISLPAALAEAELLLRQVQLETLRNAELAREAETRKNDLVVYLAHDLKTPLTSVLGYLTLLRDEEDISPELQQKYLSIATGKAQRLEDLINEFFEITRFNLKGLTLETTRLNLSRMLEQVNDEFRPLYDEKNLTSRVNIQPGIEMVADAGKLERVVDNLLRNAVNYSYPGSAIEITAVADSGLLRLSVQNAGDTIPEHKLARIFEQFYRLDSARSASGEGGSGLGLAIAKEIVELHGGEITAESADEVIRFRVVLPLASPAVRKT